MSTQAIGIILDAISALPQDVEQAQLISAIGREIQRQSSNQRESSTLKRMDQLIQWELNSRGYQWETLEEKAQYARGKKFGNLRLVQ